MECGVNYHKLIKGTEWEWMSFVLPALDSAASQGHYFRGLSGLFLELGLVSQMFLSTQVCSFLRSTVEYHKISSQMSYCSKEDRNVSITGWF